VVLHSGCGIWTVLVMLGGRFKKEVVLDGQSYLLLIRDEGGLPEMQVLLQPFVTIRPHHSTTYVDAAYCY